MKCAQDLLGCESAWSTRSTINAAHVYLWIPREGFARRPIHLIEHAPVGWAHLRWNIQGASATTMLTGLTLAEVVDQRIRGVHQLGTTGTLYVLENAEPSRIGALYTPYCNSASVWADDRGYYYDVFAQVDGELLAAALAVERLG